MPVDTQPGHVICRRFWAEMPQKDAWARIAIPTMVVQIR